MKSLLRNVLLAQWGLFLLAAPASSQLRFGGFTTKLSGTVDAGYTAGYGNVAGASNHGWAFGGTGNFSGSYYSPNFLSFDAGFYLNQSRANSNFSSISNASGVNLSSTIFGGSHFPGSIGYSTAYNSEGNYDVPGLANYVTTGNNQTFSINWNENVPNLPSFSAGYQLGDGNYSVYGTNDEGNNKFQSLNLRSNYILAGFHLGAYYTTGTSEAVIPPEFTGGTQEETHATDSGYGFSANHILPWHGSATANYSHSNWGDSFEGANTNEGIDLVNGTASIHPEERLTLSTSVSYSNNLTGQLFQSVVSAGGAVPGLNTNQSSNSLDVMSTIGYRPAQGFLTSGFVEYRSQYFLGENYAVNSFGGSASYTHKLLRGTFSSNLTVTDYLTDTGDDAGENSLGFATSDSYANVICGWHVNGNFQYSQNVQTLIIAYTNSFFNYSGSMRRRWGKFGMSMGAGASRTALTQQPDTANSSQSYSASVSYGSWINANGSYSKASGQALATGSGLVTVPVPSPTLSSSLITMYGGDGYSVGLSSSPVKRFLIAGAWSRTDTNTANSGVTSANETAEANVYMQYQVRKLNWTSGFARLEQSFSSSGQPPEIIDTFYFGVVRWFNFF